MLQGITCAAILLVLPLTSATNAQADSVDELGVRRFSQVPPPGIHPRVVFSPADLPAWREHVIGTHKGKQFFSQRYVSGEVELLARLNSDLSDRQLIDAFTRTGPFHDILYAALDAIYHEDEAHLQLAAQATANLARVILARSQQHPDWGEITTDIGDVKGLTGIQSGLGTLWLRGGSSFALAYDFLYNTMTPQQRDLCRQALSAATKDLVTWGMGFPKGRAVSNWYGYHGELGTMLLAIEGEEGFRSERYEMFVEMMRNWMDVSLYPDGGSNEDGYVANTALREGTLAMIAMARRGVNLFHHPNYQAYWRWLVHSMIPGEHEGRTVGYTCAQAAPYESMPTLSRWAMPGHPLVNYHYRRFKGEDYSLNNRWQYGDLSLLFAMDWDETPTLPLVPSELALPLSAYFPYQGLLTTRSEWSDECVYLNFYARHDAWMDRHENVDRGRFVLAAHGREWSVDRGWSQYYGSENHNLVHIDGLAQAEAATGRGKVPNGVMLEHIDTDFVTAGTIDLKNAYDWLWAHAWEKPDDGWEPETRSFRALGWLWQRPGQPPALHGSDDPENPQYNFMGCHLWRRPHNPVRYANRTCLLVRGSHPYVLILDNVRKDDSEHEYAWYMQMAADVVFEPQDGGDVLFVEEGEPQADGRAYQGSRRLLVRPLGESQPEVVFEEYLASVTRNQPNKGRRLVIRRQAVASHFVVLLYPFRTTNPPAGDGWRETWQSQPLGAEMPRTEWGEAHTSLTVQLGDNEDVIQLTTDGSGRTAFTLSRNGEAAAALDPTHSGN